MLFRRIFSTPSIPITNCDKQPAAQPLVLASTDCLCAASPLQSALAFCQRWAAGWVAERLKAPVLKTGGRVTVS